MKTFVTETQERTVAPGQPAGRIKHSRETGDGAGRTAGGHWPWPFCTPDSSYPPARPGPVWPGAFIFYVVGEECSALSLSLMAGRYGYPRPGY